MDMANVNKELLLPISRSWIISLHNKRDAKLGGEERYIDDVFLINWESKIFRKCHTGFVPF